MIPAHTVLGEDIESMESRRMEGLLKAVGAHVTRWPMFAEDFLGLIRRDQL